MGSQQIVYIILSIFLVVLLGSAGYKMYQEFELNQARSALIHEINRFYASALEYSKKPETLNGGNGSYLDWKPEFSLNLPDLGVVKYKAFEDRINFLAIGKIVGEDKSTNIKILVKYKKNKEPIIKVLN